MALPPSFSAPVEVAIAPPPAADPVWMPFTYSRTVLPS